MGLNADDADPNDLVLISRCLMGDAAACEALYRRHAGKPMAYFRRSGFRLADAEDLTQDTFVRALRSLHTFDAAKGRFDAWLAAIARNVARRRWHKRKRSGHYDMQLAELALEAGDDPVDDPASALQAREEDQALRDCIASLPEDLAHLVRMRYVDAMTTRGIAAAAALPEATVRLRLGEALAALERCLKGKGVLE